MLLALELITGIGLLFASRPGMRMGNPFQIYFFVWFAVFAGYHWLEDSFISLTQEFYALLLGPQVIALALLGLSQLRRFSAGPTSIDPSQTITDSIALQLCQVVSTIGSPFAFRKAMSLANEDVFSETGYIRLRTVYGDEGLRLGLWDYVALLSFVTTSVTAVLYAQKRVSLSRLSVSLLTTAAYLYITTGRTFVLLVGLLVTIPLLVHGYLKLRGSAISFLLILGLFVFIAGMTKKGVSFDLDLEANIDVMAENLRSYTIAPVLALSTFVAEPPHHDVGLHTFRFFTAAAFSFGLSATPPANLVREYAFVPDPTNVYTVYEVYFRDFGYPGILVPPLFLIGHWWLFIKAHASKGAWVFLYAASTYPLVMQFFQDQYFSLLSQWIQVSAWVWLLTRPKNFGFTLPWLKLRIAPNTRTAQ